MDISFVVAAFMDLLCVFFVREVSGSIVLISCLNFYFGSSNIVGAP